MLPSLPIAPYLPEIGQTIKGSQVTIIVAETGAGKSTQVPQLLLEQGHRNIVVTQPRRLAARAVSARVAAELGLELGGRIGFRTGFERNCSAQTECLFCTDGVEAIREIRGGRYPEVLIIDEVHEWNINIEVLVAWVRRHCVDYPAMKVVLMSATIEAERLAQYFGNAPVVVVPGREFTVTEEEPRGDLLATVSRLAASGRNVLVFQPGKAEIAQTVADLKECGVHAEVLPLHGELEPDDQDLVFRHYGRPKVVVATNVAQTSVTIDDVDAVVDSGVEKRIETSDGIESLVLRRISRADERQRQGRAGRCRPGVYVNCYTGREDQLAFPRAEIERLRLDRVVLHLLEQGIDPEELEFFHQPDHTKIHDAKACLRSLGALSADGTVTPLGRQISRLPVDVKYARMIIEAEQRGVLDDVLTIAACLEAGGIGGRNDEDLLAIIRTIGGERQSDLLAQLALFNAGRKARGNDQLRALGIFPKAFYRAREIRQKLADTLIDYAKRTRSWVNFKSSGDRRQILLSAITGMVDHLFRRSGSDYINADPTVRRQLDRKSVVNPWLGSLLVGQPFDMEVKTRRGSKIMLRLVTMASQVDVLDLIDLFPERCVVRPKNFRLVGITPEVVIGYDKVAHFGDLELQKIETVEQPWSAVVAELGDDCLVQELRREIIEQQFVEAKRYGGPLYERYLTGDCAELRDHPAVRQPQFFGVDPATGKPIEAFPVLTSSVAIYGSHRLSWTLDKARSEQSLIDLGLVPFNPVASSQPLVLAPEPVGAWRHGGQKRWVHCPKGHSIKVARDAVASTAVRCDFCGATTTFDQIQAS